MSNKSKRLKAQMRAQHTREEHNERVRRRELERRALLRPHEVRLSKQNTASSTYRRYQRRLFGKLGAASPVRILAKDGKPVEQAR
jgi:hypothetical protein